MAMAEVSASAIIFEGDGILNYKVYKHTTPNSKVYIGITRTSIKKRWGEQGQQYKGQMFYNAIQKYGWDNIKHEVLYENLSEQQAKIMEMSLIHYYKSNNRQYGYNRTNGGDIRNDKKVICITDNNIFNSATDAAYYYNVPVANISAVCLGNRKSTKINNIQYVFKYLNEDNEIIKTTFESKAKNKKKILCITTNEIFDSISDAAKKYNLSVQNISRACQGKNRYCGKYNEQKLYWSLIDENDNILNIKKSNQNICTKVICTTTNMVFDSIKEAAKFYNINIKSNNISLVCMGKRNYCGIHNNQKLKWSYLYTKIL